MNSEDYYNDEIDKTLNSLEGLTSAETDPYFLSRLEARIQREVDEKNAKMTVWEFLLQPRMSLSLACLLILVNVGLLVWSNNQQVNSSNDRSELLQAVASEYSLNPSSYEALYKE